MFLKDQDRFSIPLVCSGSLPHFVRSHWDCSGFEYFANPKSRSDGFITWQMDNAPTIKMGAAAVGPDQGTDGSGVDQRLIPEEPMVRLYHLFTLLSLLILVVSSPLYSTWACRVCHLLFPPDMATLTPTTANWQTIDLTTMTFPAEMLIDYVRVYQREGNTNIGCDPPDYPTADYISRHPEAYSSSCCFY
jgi:hypothetical protein